MTAGLVCEVVMTMFFLIVILGSTDSKAPGQFAPIPIGLSLTLIHLVSIPVTNTSVNPARSTGVAIYAGAWALRQLWLFWFAPLLGGALGGLGYRTLVDTTRSERLQNLRSKPNPMVGPKDIAEGPHGVSAS